MRNRIWLAAACALLVAAIAVIGTGQWYVHHHNTADRDATIRSAADTAVTSVLSYDYRRLRAGMADTVPLLTGDAKDQYLALQQPLTSSAPKLHAVVQAEVKSMAVLASDADTARVLLFVDQTSSSTKLSQPQLDQSRVLVTMQRSGGHWLVATLVAI